MDKQLPWSLDKVYRDGRIMISKVKKYKIKYIRKIGHKHGIDTLYGYSLINIEAIAQFVRDIYHSR